MTSFSVEVETSATALVSPDWAGSIVSYGEIVISNETATPVLVNTNPAIAWGDQGKLLAAGESYTEVYGHSPSAIWYGVVEATPAVLGIRTRPPSWSPNAGGGGYAGGPGRPGPPGPQGPLGPQGPQGATGPDEVLIGPDDPYIPDPAATIELWYDTDEVVPPTSNEDEVWVGATDPYLGDPNGVWEMWWDTTTTPYKLWVRVAGVWEPGAAETASEVAIIDIDPYTTDPAAADELWYDTSTTPGTLKARVAGAWVDATSEVVIGPDTVLRADPTGQELWVDTSSGTPYILKAYIGGQWVPVGYQPGGVLPALTFGLPPDPGHSTAFSRADHAHGTPLKPAEAGEPPLDEVWVGANVPDPVGPYELWVDISAMGTLPPPTPATGADAGTPGTFTPVGCEVPPSLADMGGVVANPQTAWADDEYVVLGDGSSVTWDGSAWVVWTPPPGDPSIATLVPNTAEVSTTTTVTVNGANFEADAQVEADGQAQATTFVSATRLTVSYTAPATTATVQFSVRNVSTTAESNDVPFEVTPTPVVPLATTANKGAPGTYSPAGSRGPVDMAEAQSVLANPTSSWMDSWCYFDGSATDGISWTPYDGFSGAQWVPYPAHTPIGITSINPTTGPRSGGTTVTVTGIGFKDSRAGFPDPVDGLSLIWNSTLHPVTWRVISDTEIEFDTPAYEDGPNPVTLNMHSIYLRDANLNGAFTYEAAPKATGADAGTPGQFTPPGSYRPVNLGWLVQDAVVANPATAWAAGQYVVLGDSSWASWDGTAWQSQPPPATGATMGYPGYFTPTGGASGGVWQKPIPPADLAAMASIPPKPTSLWSPNAYVVLGDTSECYWDGTAWVVGQVPVVAAGAASRAAPTSGLPVLKAKMPTGEWVIVSGAVNEVEVAPDEPTDPAIELWFDPDAVPSAGSLGELRAEVMALRQRLVLLERRLR